MGKIDEFEQKIIKQGMTDADFVEYEKLLKILHKTSVCVVTQHIITPTALQKRYK